MAPDEDTSFTYVTLVGTVAGVFAESVSVILLSLALAAALKALPSLYDGRGDGKPGHGLIMAEDWIMFLASVAGYLLTAGTGDLSFAVGGLTVAAIGKAAPSLYRHQRYGVNPGHGYSPTADGVMFSIAMVSVLLSLVSGNLDWAIYGLVFSFMGKGLTRFQSGRA